MFCSARARFETPVLLWLRRAPRAAPCGDSEEMQQTRAKRRAAAHVLDLSPALAAAMRILMHAGLTTARPLDLKGRQRSPHQPHSRARIRLLQRYRRGKNYPHALSA